MSFWATYVLLKEGQGISRSTTLDLIETKFGLAKRTEIENEIHGNQE
ncbi:hypothetical protein [Gorillibacterium sp. sgz5001074]